MFGLNHERDVLVNTNVMAFYAAMPHMKSFAERLKEARKEAKLTQEQLAVKAGIGQTAIANMEGGDRKGTRHYGTLAMALGVNAFWLETGKGAKRGMSKQAAEIAIFFDSLDEKERARMANIIRAAIGPAADDDEVEERIPVTRPERSAGGKKKKGSASDD